MQAAQITRTILTANLVTAPFLLRRMHSLWQLLPTTVLPAEGRSGWDSAGEGDDPVRCDARKEVDPSRLGIGFAHVLRGVYGVDSLWLEQSKISLLRDIGSIVADTYGPHRK